MSRTNKDRKAASYPRSFIGDQMIKDWMEQKAYDDSFSELDLAMEAAGEFGIVYGSDNKFLLEFAREAIDRADAKKDTALRAAEDVLPTVEAPSAASLAEIIRDQ